VTDVLGYYARERGPVVSAPEVMGRAIELLTRFWQGRVISEVRPETCRRYGEKRGRSTGTVRRELAVLQAAVNHAYRNGMLIRSVHVQLPKSPPPRDRWLTRQEAARLLRASRTDQARLYMPLFILLGLYTGRRKEAILSLRWPQVDLEAGVIETSRYLDANGPRSGGERCPSPRNFFLTSAEHASAELILDMCCTSTASASATSRRALPQRAGVQDFSGCHRTR
jgi:hypothetical protein